MEPTKKKSKKHLDRDGEQFMPMPMVTLQSERLGALAPRAAKLLLDICSQWNGRNNGDLSAALTILKRRGWRSATTLALALDELLAAGFVARTRFGGRHQCALYAVTWLALGASDALQKKLDPDLVRGFRRGAYLVPNYRPVVSTKGPALAGWKRIGAPETGAQRSGLRQKVEQAGTESPPVLQNVDQSEEVSYPSPPICGHLSRA